MYRFGTRTGEPVEFFRTPASVSDIKGLEFFDFDRPPGAEVYADQAFIDYRLADVLAEAEIHLYARRRATSNRPGPPWLAFLQHQHRKIIETTGSLLQCLLPQSIHAVTAQDFELKVVLFVLAVSIGAL